jgi:hypothetical protein
MLRIRDLAATRTRYGYFRISILRRREGPTDNAFVESFDGRFWNEGLNTHWFPLLNDARGKIEAWRGVIATRAALTHRLAG